MIFFASAVQLPLHDIVDDHVVSWWPLAPGWWLLLAALSLAGLLLSIYWRRFRRQRLQQQSIERLLQTPANNISELNLRLKQVMLLKYPRAELAHLSTQAWQQRLVSELPDTERGDFASKIKPFLDLQYQAHTQSVVDAYQALVIEWWTLVRPRFKKGLRNV